MAGYPNGKQFQHWTPTGMATGLSAIFMANRAALLRFLRARGAGDNAEDLLQDMWMKLEAKDLGPVSVPVPYLYRMANNLMLDRYRSAIRRERREQDWAEVERMAVRGGVSPGTQQTRHTARAVLHGLM